MTSPKTINPLTLPLLNGRANNEVTTPQSTKNRISDRITRAPPEPVSIRTARTKSYAAPTASPSTSDHRK